MKPVLSRNLEFFFSHLQLFQKDLEKELLCFVSEHDNESMKNNIGITISKKGG